MAHQIKLGIIGLGKMGGNLALQAIEKNINVVGKARSKKPELEEKGVEVVTDYKSFVDVLVCIKQLARPIMYMGVEPIPIHSHHTFAAVP